MKLYFHLLVLLIFVGLSACSAHKIDIQQGNVITTEMTERIELGMTKKQVKFIFGSPLIQDTFHHNRWDYVYSLVPGDENIDTEYTRVTIFFDDNVVSKITKDIHGQLKTVQ